MPDPLSISAAIVGLALPALHSARLLQDDLKKIVDAPEAVRRLTKEADTITASLSLLNDIEDQVWTSLGLAVHDQAKATIQSCETACDVARADILRWTKRSREGKLLWRARVHVGCFQEQQLKTYRERLQTHRVSFNSIVGTATLYASLRNSHMTDELCNSITSQQNQLVNASSTMQTELSVVQRSLAEISLRSMAGPGSDTECDDEDDAETADTNLKDLLEALKLSQALLCELLSKSAPSEVTKSAKDRGTTNITFGKNEKGMQIGVSHGSVTWHSDK